MRIGIHVFARGRSDNSPVAALGSVMLKLAGRSTDGTITWMVVKTLANHITSTITAAVRAEGRPAPRIAVGLPICVTNDVDHARERAARSFALYGHLPSYRAMLDREGVEGPADVAIIGDEESVSTELEQLADAGCTDFAAVVVGSSDEQQRSKALLSGLAHRN